MSIKNKINKEESNVITKPKRKNIYCIIILIIFACIFIYSGKELLKIYQEYKVSVEEYNNLKIYTEEIALEGTSNNELIKSIDFESLKAINSDIVGWIYFENINIDYPVVKGLDNSYYLNNTFNKNTNSSGSIFMDYRNTSDFKDLNTIIYGHNMRNGSMFGELKKFLDEEFYRDNSYFWILSNESKYKCEIFSVYVDENTSESYNIEFKNKDEYNNYLNMVREKSIYNTEINPTADDLVITLSTCAAGNKSSRFIVHAKLQKVG